MGGIPFVGKSQIGFYFQVTQNYRGNSQKGMPEMIFFVPLNTSESVYLSPHLTTNPSMAILGNFTLALATLVYIGMLSLLFGRMPSGDAVVGYAWSVIIYNLIFAISMIATAGAIGATGGFAWIPGSGSARFGWVAFSLVSAIIIFATATLFYRELGQVNIVFRSMVLLSAIVLPAVLIITGFILVNPSFRSSLPGEWYTWPATGIAWFGMAGMAVLMAMWVSNSVKKQAADLKHVTEYNDTNQQRLLQEIDEIDVENQFAMLMVYTGKNQDKVVWTKALEKVKSHPDWQGELIRLIDNQGVLEAFTFLAYHEVPDPIVMAEAVNRGIGYHADYFRRRIRECNHPSNLYPGMFSFYTERMLLTANRFKSYGVDFRAAVSAVKAAHDEPSEYDKPVFTSVAMIEKWLKTN